MVISLSPEIKEELIREQEGWEGGHSLGGEGTE